MNKYTKRTLKTISLLLVLLLLMCTLPSVSSATDMNVLRLTRCRQQYSNWCWAACSSCALIHYNVNISQASFAAYVKGESPAPNETATFSEVLRGLQHYNVTGTYTGNNISFGTIRSNINNGRPIMTGLAPNWVSSFHMVILNGFDGTNSSNGFIEYMDPFTGNFVSLSYLDFRDGEGDYGEWISTLYSISSY